MVDFSEPPNDKERLKLRKRRGRLHAMEASVIDATTAMRKLAAPSGISWINVRYAFVDTGEPVSVQRRGDPSDRRLPDKEDRPPATQVMSPRGAALRVYLAALFETQARTRLGNRLPLVGGGGATSWTDLLASDARSSGAGKYHMSASAKKLRQMASALDRLAAVELIELVGKQDEPGTGKYEKFRLMHEGGHRATGPQRPLPCTGPASGARLPSPGHPVHQWVGPRPGRHRAGVHPDDGGGPSIHVRPAVLHPRGRPPAQVRHRPRRLRGARVAEPTWPGHRHAGPRSSPRREGQGLRSRGKGASAHPRLSPAASTATPSRCSPGRSTTS